MDELTSEEIRLMRLLGEVAVSFSRVVGRGPTRDADIAEIHSKIHDLQARVAMQAAARMYPNMLRRLGEVFDG